MPPPKSRAEKPIGPATSAAPITPGDGTVITATSAIYVGVSGHLAVEMLYPDSGAATVIFKNVPVGVFPISVERVLSTGTTASELVALYN